jgi:epoxyqueuosine reductase
VRNVLIAAGNSGSAAFVPACEGLLGDASSDVRGMAVWALSRLLPAESFATLRDARLGEEPDETVRLEWMMEN